MQNVVILTVIYAVWHFMLSVESKLYMLSVVMLNVVMMNVVMLNVVAPLILLISNVLLYKPK